MPHLEDMYMKSRLSIYVSLVALHAHFFPSIQHTQDRLKQGCNLSPILFNLLIKDIGDTFDHDQCQPPSILKLSLNHLLYVDDLVLISETKNGLQQCLNNKLQKYCEKKRTANNKKRLLQLIHLGSIISNTGNFKININELSIRASRAMYHIIS